MDINEVIVYRFQLGNSDPEFQDFVLSFTNDELKDLRNMLYEAKLDKHRDGYGAAIYGRDRYGCVDIPKSIRKKHWDASGNELFDYIKNLWVASVLGYSNPGINPLKQIQWTTTRARAVTSHDEGWDILSSVVIDLGLSYIGARVGGVRLPKVSVPKASSLNPQKLLKREYFKLHPRITNGNHGVITYGRGQFDVGHRASTFFSTEVMQTGKMGIQNYRTIYFNKMIGDKNFSIAINPWKRTIFHEGPGVFK